MPFIINFLEQYLDFMFVGFASLMIGLIIMKILYHGHRPALCDLNSQQQLNDIQILQVKLKEQEQENYRLETKLAVTEERAKRIPEIQNDQFLAEKQATQLREEMTLALSEQARLKQHVEQIPQLQHQLAARETDLKEFQAQLTALQSENTELQTRMTEERKRSEEKQQLLQETETKLKIQFENLANRILDDKGRKFAEQNKTSLDNIVNPLKEQLGEFKRRIEDVYVNDTKDRVSLREEILSLKRQTIQMNQDALNLTKALKGDQKVQGNWGELVLERVLEQSGLRKGTEYFPQGAYRNEANQLLKPDVIVRLPEGKDVVIDSKVSLIAHERYCNEEEESEKSKLLRTHIDSVRTHIKTLSEKDYSSLEGLRSLDFVLMFMPIEAAFMTAFQTDEKLFSDAFEHKIIVVTPTTLLATMRTIENIWRYERQNENAKLIADKAGTLYDKLRGVVEEFDKLGKQLATVNTTYEGVFNRLTQGQGNLIRQASDFVELGVKVKKTLPKNILEKANIKSR